MRKPFLTIAAIAGLSALSFGALNAQGDAQPGAIDVSAVEGGNYTADTPHSMVGWSVSHLGFNNYFGIFGDVSGTLQIDPANLSAAKVDVTIPVASVTVPAADMKAHLLKPGEDGAAPDFFGPNPKDAHFVSTKVEPTGETTANITGDLTLNGVTHPVTIAAELSGMGTNAMNQKKTLGFHGTTTIQRSKYNAAFGIPFGISDNVDLNISIAFEK